MSRRGRLAYVTQWFTPEPITVPRWIADALRGAGWDVLVVTGVPNYPTGTVAAGHRAGELTTETLDGFTVRRTPLYPAHDTSAPRRFANYASWALSATIGAARQLASADVALVYSSPATAALPAMVWRLLGGTRYVMIIQDLWPDSIFASGFLSGPVARIADVVLTAFTKASYRLASHICVISPGMRDTLIARGVPADKITLVYNWVDESIFAPAAADPGLRAQLGLDADDLVVMYAGNLGHAQGLDTFVRAVAAIDPAERVHGVVVGDGVDRDELAALAAAIAPDRVHVVGPRPLTDMPGLMAASDLQLVSLTDRELFTITMPSKVQSILASGCPALVSAPGDAARVVADHEAGWTARPEDVAALTAAIRAAQAAGPAERRRRGDNGRRLYREQMSCAVGTGRLGDILDRTARSKRKP